MGEFKKKKKVVLCFGELLIFSGSKHEIRENSKDKKECNL